MDEPLTYEHIRAMFRDFGLEHHEDRQQFVPKSTIAGVDVRQCVFVWTGSTVDTLGEDNAKLAQHP